MIVWRDQAIRRLSDEGKIRRYWIARSLYCSIALLGAALTAQAATFTAATCNTTDVQAAVNSAANGDMVTIPACPSGVSWTSGVSIAGKGIRLQGAGSGRIVAYSAASSAIPIGTGLKSFPVAGYSQGFAGSVFVVGQTLTISETGARANFMTGTITGFSGGVLSMTISNAGGSCGSTSVSNCKRWLISTPPSTVLMNNSANTDLFSVTESAAFSIDISGIKIASGVGGAHAFEWFYAPGGQPIVLHDCWIENGSSNNSSGNATLINVNTLRGVIANCSFDSSPYSGNISLPAGNQAGAISVQDDTNATGTSWTTSSNMGNLDAGGTGKVYVEASDFHAFIFAINTDNNGRLAARYNVIDNGGAFGTHGADTSFYGQRYFEFYNNVLNFNGYNDGSTFNINRWFYLRGGTFLISSNTIPALQSTDYGAKQDVDMTVMNLQRSGGPHGCWGAGTAGGADYPAPRQVGLGFVTGLGKVPSGTGSANDAYTYVGDSEPAYMWGNSRQPLTHVVVSDFGGLDCINPDTSSAYIVAGRDFFNGSAAKPGWIPYVYPHPLAAGVGPGGSTTITAASCSQTDVQAVLNAVTAATMMVRIPAGTCTWTSPVTFTVPSDNANLSILGAGNLAVTGGGDATVIVDNVSHAPADNALLGITVGAAGTSFRLGGITFQGGNGGTTFNGALRIGGNSQNVRMDHMHFKRIPGVSADMDGWIYGVVDHCLWDMAPNSVDNGLRIGHGGWGGGQFGDGSWADATTFGSNRFIFMEDNTFNNGFANDVNNGGRLVFRHNTLNLSEFQVHEMEDRNRAPRAWEIYGNSFTCDPAQLDCGSSAIFVRGGTGLVWGNTATNAKNFITANNDRTNSGHAFAGPPNGFGYCGTVLGPSAWDQNSDASGYACFDQVGRGKGDLLPQTYWPLSAFWSHEALEPIYEWNDTVTFAPTWGGVLFSNDTSIQKNRDYYLYTPLFNGTAGVGSGTLSNRPAACTPMVAYWVTDTDTLYQCSATNTWSPTPYYTPYPYPHPLVSGSAPPPPDTSSPSVPTGLAATAVSSTTINLSWTASTDNVGVAGYGVYRNNVWVSSATSGTSYAGAGLSASTNYSYKVTAYDTAGNVSAASSAVSTTTLAASPVNTTTAASCNVSDVQAAVDASVNGGTVIIPNGSCTWASGISTSKQITLQGQSAGGVTLTDQAASADLLTFTIGTSFHTTIANLRFLPGTGTGNYITVQGTGLAPLMHDCDFNLVNFQLNHAVQWFVTGGVIWNTLFESTQNLGGACGEQIGSDGGTIVVKSNRDWNTASTMGTLDTNGDQNLYIEDSTFSYVGQAPDVDTNGRVVLRHNAIVGSSGLTHGVTSFVGGRQVEIYDNVFTNPNANRDQPRYFWFRAGTAVITGNSIQAISNACHGARSSFQFVVEDAQRAGGYGCCLGYMCMQQPGSGSDGLVHSPPNTSSYAANPYQISDPVYIWGNTGTGASNVSTNEGSPQTCFNGFSTANFFVQNRDYFVDNGVKPGWTRYAYPHPFRSGGGSPPPPDTQPPTVPSSVSFTGASSSTLVLSWNASSDNVAVTGYKLDLSLNNAFSSFVSGFNNKDLGNISSFLINGLSAGTTYYARLRAYDAAANSSGNSATAQGLTLPAGTVVNPPVITQQPQNAAANVGGSAGFSVTATGSGLSYQWQYAYLGGWQNIPGALSNGYTLTNVQLSQNGLQYRCAVTNAGGSVTSNPATLQVTNSGIGGTPLPAIDPDNLPKLAGINDALTIGNYPNSNVTFTWSFVAGGTPYGAPGIGSRVSSHAASIPSFTSGAKTNSLMSYGLTPGTYQVSVQAQDAGGNTSPTLTGTISLVVSDFSQMKVYPNPWRKDKHAGKSVTFANIPLGSTVKLFTVSGHEVKSIGESGGQAIWDLTNDSGDKVASGVYLYVITDSQGDKMRGKVGVIK